MILRVISSHYSLLLLLICFFVASSSITGALSSGVIHVKYKFAGSQRSIVDLKVHDSLRQLRILTGVDLPLGGSGRPDGLGLYYARIGIGTPSKHYYLQVDTGSDIISTAGYFVNDTVLYDRVSGDLETSSANGSVIFGCGATQSGNLGSSNEEALDGILGFGKANSSMISQLAASGKVKNMFAHCLDGVNGGGIFAIGHVVRPKVNMTPLVPNQPHYNANMTAIQVGRDFLNFTADMFDSADRKGTIIDSETTLAYLPEMIYEPLVNEILSQQPQLKLQTVHDEYTCFQYSKSLDDAFPNVTFHFANLVTLKVNPHEYLFPYSGLWCIGWQNSGLQSRDQKNMTLLGDLVLSNKLVVYDLENQAIGWTEYNCSSSIQVMDERTGTVHLVGSHYISSACHSKARFIMILIMLATLLHFFFELLVQP
ncbi:Eukaryotic aspartyl protease family protein isoform 2 [Hibiscus syriacus]|uniref:Eukaryotic aspartyl protease family protein isoform 2 n=1 Tax=Hibiscus syriacus TaxID=106335 RepID=A0A6A3CXL4_HIBSY|nr:Eukaryotic aspartyl protease family protein isoform 2 [Hibiscus syriacus]